MSNSNADQLGSGLRQTGATGLLAIAWLTVPAILGFTLLAYLGSASSWLTGLGPIGPVVFACLFAITSGCGLLPTYAQAVLAGWAFGIAVGITASLAGFVGGALLGWVIASAVSGDRIVHLIDRHPHGKIIRRSIVERGFWQTGGLVALLRLPPNSPFALTNLVMAAARVPLVTYLTGTALGMLPRTALVVAMAAAAAAHGESLQEFVTEGPGPWMFVGGIILLAGVLAIIGAVAKRAIARLS